jgi:lipid II:glycine glycyltransferase (peptidoglycan interpeptide bridge formation enzyme)
MQIHPEPIEDIHTPGTLFQSPLWGDFKQERGHEVKAFSVTGDVPNPLPPSGTIQEFDLLMIFRLFSGHTAFGYIPYGPDVEVAPETQGEFLEEVAERVRPWLPKHCTHIRFDLPWESPFEDADFYESGGGWLGPPEDRLREMRMNFGTSRRNLRKAPTDMQPTDTVILDLTQSREDLLSAMKPKTRYNIRLARRRGVRVTAQGSSALDRWYSLYRRTAERKNIVQEKLSYFANLLDISEHPEKRGLSKTFEIKVFIADHGDDLLGGIIAARFAEKAYYLYGATSDLKRNLMASYALQWEAIRWAQREGATSYDLFGIPPADNPEHPMYGLYRFKTGFGGEVHHYRGCWDYPYDRDLYNAAVLGRGLHGGYHR